MNCQVLNETGREGRSYSINKENTWYQPTAWSPDGKSVLVIITKKDKTDQLARVTIADGSVRVLKSMDWRFTGAAWAVLFTREMDCTSYTPR